MVQRLVPVLLTIGALALPASAPAATPAKWLCRPGTQNPCNGA